MDCVEIQKDSFAPKGDDGLASKFGEKLHKPFFVHKT
jgi:hypothetical protein